MPQQQQQGEMAATTEPVSSNSSGSIGPFFAVMSVLMVLALVSCVAGRIYSRRQALTPLDSIKHRGCWAWMKGRCRGQCVGGDVEAGAAKVNDINQVQA